MVACNYCTNVQFENSLRYSVKEVMKTQSPRLMLIDIAPFMYEHDVTYAYAHEPDNAELFVKYNVDRRNKGIRSGIVPGMLRRYSWIRIRISGTIITLILWERKKLPVIWQRGLPILMTFLTDDAVRHMPTGQKIIRSGRL